MKRYRLVATGEHAKQLTMCDGGPDLLLWPERPILMGRAVHEGEGYKYPKEWISLSSKHCTLQWKVDDGGEVRAATACWGLSQTAASLSSPVAPHVMSPSLST
jgi:hypothetical protein